MNRLLPIASLLVTLHTQLPAEEVDWEKIDVASEGKFASAMKSGSGGWLVLQDTAPGTLKAFPLPSPPAKSGFFPKMAEIPAEFSEVLGGKNSIILTVAWLGTEIPENWVSQYHHKTAGRITTYYRAGLTTITRTVLASPEEGAIFVHLHADQPGILSIKASVTSPLPHQVRVEDRRQLILSPKEGEEPSCPSHVWVLPFESDVATEGESITIRGEGEALVVWAFGAPGTPATTLAETLKHLGDRHDPGHTPPNPSKIWHGVLENLPESAKDSP